MRSAIIVNQAESGISFLSGILNEHLHLPVFVINLIPSVVPPPLTLAILPFIFSLLFDITC